MYNFRGYTAVMASNDVSSTLPKALERIFSSLLSELGVTSWKVFGRLDGATVSMRFGTQAFPGENQENIQKEIP